MLVIPAIDILGGKCVRLRQGDYQQETVYSGDPVLVAQRWIDDGAEYLHLVDLDGAKTGAIVHADVIRCIATVTRSTRVKCQLGGGIRDTDAIERAFDLGLERLVIGTSALEKP